MNQIALMKRFRAKALATVGAGLISIVAATPSFAYVDFIVPPNVSIDSFSVFAGNTGGANKITNVDQWDTLGYALSVFDTSTHFTDYIVQRVQAMQGSGVTGPASPGTSAGYSIGIAAVITGTQSGATYTFDQLKSFSIFLQNNDSGVISGGLSITTIGDLVTGYRVLDGTVLSSAADPTTTLGGTVGSTNSGFTSGTIYQGGFIEENVLVPGSGYNVPDPAATTQPFLQLNAGGDLLAYLAGLVPPLNFIQASAGSNTTPDASVKELNGASLQLSVCLYSRPIRLE